MLLAKAEERFDTNVHINSYNFNESVRGAIFQLGQEYVSNNLISADIYILISLNQVLVKTIY